MTKITEIITNLKFFLTSELTKETYRLESEDFSRRGKIGFKNAVLLMGSQMRGSLDFDLYKTLDSNDLESISKSAYSQCRYKIKPELYKDWNVILLDNVYGKAGTELGISNLKKYKGYYIDAIDGSKLTLPNTELMKEEFGIQLGGSKTTRSETAMCLLMCSYDVLNHYYIKSSVSHLQVGENTVVKSWIQDLRSDAITLFDRGFPSFFLFSLLNKYKKPYVMRVKISFNQQVKAFVSSGKTEEIVTMISSKKESFEEETVAQGDKVGVRLIRVELSTGEVEVLVTNLMDETLFKVADFKELYGLRWGIETSYDTLKNKFLLTCFSGQKVASIYQDIYATIFVHNLYSIISNEAQIIVNEKFKHRKYDYLINKSVSIAIYKEKIMTIFISEEPDIIVQKLVDLFPKYTEPIRPNRHYKRKKSINKRRNLFTQNNYKRN